MAEMYNYKAGRIALKAIKEGFTLDDMSDSYFASAILREDEDDIVAFVEFIENLSEEDLKYIM